MKQKSLLVVTTSVLMLITTLFVDNGWIYAVVGLMATATVLAIRRPHSASLKITRWAKANPVKTQILIGLLQLLIIFIALWNGYNLRELGYRLSEGPAIVFGVVMVWGFFSIRFLPKQGNIAIPAVVTRDRIAYTGIILSAFVILLITGNRIEDKFPNSPICFALKAIDQSIFGESVPDAEKSIALDPDSEQILLTDKNSNLLAFAAIGTNGTSINPEDIDKKNIREKIKGGKKAEKLEKKKKKLLKKVERLRKMFGTGSTILTVLLVILLVITTCAGICLIAIGGSAGAVVLGVLLLGGSIFGFVKIFQKKKRIKEE